MRILPDGTVEIKRAKSGETKIVKPEELPNYGISYSDYAEQAKAFTSVGGKAEGLIAPLTTEQQKAADAQKAKTDIIDTAKQFQQVINEKDKYSKKDYENIISSMASSLVLKKKEAENLGASLTGNELAILSGQVPQIQQRGQNLLQKALGIIPKQTTKVLDDEETIKNKLNLLVAGLEGKQIDPALFEQSGSKNSFGAGLAKNAGQDAKDILNGILGLPGAALNYANDKASQGKPVNPVELVGDATLGMGKGILSEANQLLGRPLEGGDVVSRIGERAYNKPVTTALDILPFLGPLKRLGAGKLASEASEASKVADATKLTETTLPETATKTGLLPDILNAGKNEAKALQTNLKGRLATNVGVVDPTDVARSEKMASEALQITNKLTRRGMAQELKDFVPKAGKAIDDWVGITDKKIGPQSLDDVTNTIRQRLEQTTVGRANPELIDVAMEKIKNDLYGGELPGGMKAGEPFSTSFSKMNETRKLLNSSIPDKWFSSKPTVSNTDNLSHLNWEASKTIKDLISEADDTGKIKDLIHKQYVSMEYGPTLSELSLKGGGVPQGVFRAFGRALNAVTEPIQIASARAMQGKPATMLNDILKTSVPDVPGVTSTSISPLPKTYTQKLLPQDIIENMLSKKGDPQALRLVRDMRYGQGNPSFKDQSKILEQAKKKKYK